MSPSTKGIDYSRLAVSMILFFQILLLLEKVVSVRTFQQLRIVSQWKWNTGAARRGAERSRGVPLSTYNYFDGSGEQ